MKLIIAYKNFAAHRGISHIGLGVSGMNNSRSLRAAGLPADVWPVVSSDDLRQKIQAAAQTPTHVVISAPWIPTAQLAQLSFDFPETTFAVNCHSNVGFLQADPQGTQLVREALELQRGAHNFQLAANSAKFCRWVTGAFGAPCAYLPNLYYLDAPPSPALYRGGTLRIGAFGAVRPLKNFMSAAGAAVEIASRVRTDVDLWISGGRFEGGGEVVINAAKAMLKGLPHVRLVEAPWAPWAAFRRTVGHMHLLLQPSYTESFNMVTADGIAEGVPSVTSDAIDWVPKHWQARADEVSEMADTGIRLLADDHAAADGYRALTRHNREALSAWKTFTGIPAKRKWWGIFS